MAGSDVISSSDPWCARTAYGVSIRSVRSSGASVSPDLQKTVGSNCHCFCSEIVENKCTVARGYDVSDALLFCVRLSDQQSLLCGEYTPNVGEGTLLT